ncbi:MAG: 16S rRNA (uracil(1498)-N(3))-methyltransferase [Synergistaceae bacterium]|nr:16S rRNA (uracil(1498)-N(3))-methyltransferase [Synergistaceae bacterium]
MSLPRVRLDRCTREDGVWRLDAPQVRHLVKSLRCYDGAAVEGLLEENGGMKLLMRLESKDGVYCLRETGRLERTPDKLEITLLIALLKALQFDEVLRASAELGVGEILPVECERSVPKTGERLPQKTLRWRKILDEGSLVAGSVFPTKINPAVKFGEIPWDSLPENRIAAVISPASRPISEIAAREGQVVYAVGPEGDWSERETSVLLSRNFVPVTLGKRILRASTAAMAGCAWLRLGTC